MVEGFYSTGIVEFRDKGFVLDLKLLFIIVDCFLFHWFFWVIIFCLIYYSAVHDIDVCLF